MARRPLGAALALTALAAAGGALYAGRAADPTRAAIAESQRLAGAGKRAEAFDRLARAADAAPDDEALWKATVEAADDAHGLAAADAVAADFLRRHPESVALRNARGALYERQGLAALSGEHHALAFERLRTAVRIAPGLPLAQRALGEMLANQGFHRAARAHLEAALSADPSDARAWHRLGRLLSADDIPGAVAAFENAARHAPDNALARIDLASILRTANRIDDAEARLRDALRIAPDDPVVLTAVGGFLASTGAGKARRDEAERLLIRAIAAGTRVGDAHASRGSLALERGDPAAAVRLLRVAVARPLDDAPTAWYTLSRAALATGDSDLGKRALARANALRQERIDLGRAVELAFRDPGDPAKRRAVARVYAAQGDFVKAISQYRAAVALGDADARRELGALEVRLKRERRMPSMALYEAMVAEAQGLP